MAAVARNYVTFEGGKFKQRPSDTDEVIFTTVKVGGSGGKLLSIVSGKWDFNAAKLSNIVAGAATGEAVEYDQMNTALGLKQSTSEKGAANGYASLDVNGKVPSAQIPPIAIVDVSVVADNTARDALTVQEGDVAIVTGTGLTWIYDGSAWQQIVAAGAVSSVNGQTGTVSLTTTNISEGSNLYHTTARARAAAVADAINDGTTDIAPSQNAVFDALAGKSAVGHTHTAANVTDFDASALAAAVQSGTITDGVTKAPTHDAVFDALALKAASADVLPNSEPLQNNEGATINARDIVMLSAAGQVQLAQANDALSPATIFRMVKDTTIANTASGNFHKPGATVSGFTGLTALAPVYVSRATAGAYTQSLTGFVTGEHAVQIGVAISTTAIEFNPKYLVEL